MASTEYIICHECDLLLAAPVLGIGEKAHCPRCKLHLSTHYRNGSDKVLAFASSALIFLLASMAFPFLGLNAQGQKREISLLESFDILISSDYGILALIFLIMVFLVPLCSLLGIVYVYTAIKLWRPWSGVKAVMKWVTRLQPWNMSEIFIIGILVSFIKIVSLADVNLGLSFWSFILFVLFLNACLMVLDRYQTWLLLRRLYSYD